MEDSNEDISIDEKVDIVDASSCYIGESIHNISSAFIILMSDVALARMHTRSEYPRSQR